MKSLFLLSITLAVATNSFARAACCSADTPPEVRVKNTTAASLYQLDSKWTDDHGQTHMLSDLRGEPVVLVMFFAHCEYACPLLVNDMRRLRAALPEASRERTRFVLVTFDSERDTVDALHAYRVAQNLDDKWTMLRGSASDVQALAMVLGVQYKQDARGQFAHSNLITVLNVEGEIVHQRTGLNGEIVAMADAILQQGARGGLR